MPLSSDPEKRARQLANLGGRPPAPPTGNRRALKHGGHSEALLADVSAEVRELMDALGATVPVRDSDGGVPAADVVAIERAARLLRRHRRLEAWLDLYGELDEKTGDVKPAARLAGEVDAALGRALDALGCSPMARSKLGLNIARSAVLDPAAALSAAAREDDPEVRRALLARAGLLGGEVTDA